MDLNQIRKRIDEIDDEMLSLFLERMECAEEVAEYKKANGLPILNRAREREILSKVREKAGDKELYAHQLFSTLMELSKASQAELLIGNSEITGKVENMLKPFSRKQEWSHARAWREETPRSLQTGSSRVEI